VITRSTRLSAGAWWAIAAAVSVGLGLRLLAAAGGALWADEAWSLLLAVDAGTPLRVFTSINHDNNHHLYSLWLQAIGMHAPPLLARAPAIAAGTLTIVVAAMIGARRSPAAAVIAALLFAVAPILVTYGSEARGYSMMLLAAMSMLLLLDRWLDGDTPKPPVLVLAVIALLGMLSHLTMVAFVGFFVAWVFLVRRSEHGPSEALRTTARVLGPAMAVCALVIAGVMIAAAMSPKGMRVGGYSPFTLDLYGNAMKDLTVTTVGLAGSPWWLLPAVFAIMAVVIGMWPPSWIGRWRFLLPLLILGVPLGIALMRSGNPQFARYYLSSAVGVLLLISVWAGRALRGPGIAAAFAILVVAVMVGGGLQGDYDLIARHRGDPDGPLRIFEAQGERRPTVALVEERLEAVLVAAAARRGTAFTKVSGCKPAEFLLGARSSFTPARPEVSRCGTRWRLVGFGNSSRLTGGGWALYRSERLQSAGVAGSGPPPARESRERRERA